MNLDFLYQTDIAEAKKLFGKNFTCMIDTAPHGEEFEVAVITMNDLDEKWDNIQVCLFQMPACFMKVYLRKGKKRILRIGTRSGAVKDLWEMVFPIIELEAQGAIGFESYDTEAERQLGIEADIAAAEADAIAQAEAETQANADRECAEVESMAEAEAASAEAEARARCEAEEELEGGR